MTNNNNSEDFLARWLGGSLSEEEKETFETSEDYLAYKDIMEGIDKFKRPVFDVEKNLIAQKEYNRTYQSSRKTKVIRLRTWLSSAAAVIIILIGVKTLFYSSTTIRTTMAQTKTYTLPDNSIVSLNADSSIEYDKRSFMEKRELKLKGEAFFEVANGSKFTVLIKNGFVNVLGTKFNVFTRKNKIKVFCYEGKVNVKKGNDSILLTSGKGVYSDEVESLLVIETKESKSDWLQGKSSFENASLQELIEELERQYDIKINKKNIDLKRLFTGFFVHNNLQEALQTSFVPMNIKYTFIDDKTIELKDK